jgi:hypothetical protein
MDTVKLDIQKLQLLNDRIAQTLEALNQVRLSVHGLQHTSGQVPYGVMGQGIQHTSAFGPQPFASPFTQPFASPYAQPFATPFASPFTSSPFVTPFIGGGIAHTTASIDPMYQVRMAQTFPFVQSPYAPAYSPYIPTYASPYVPTYTPGMY